MRALFLIPLLAACRPACDDPSVFDTRLYEVFGNLVDFESSSTLGPQDAYPVNGYTTWSIVWGNTEEGPVTVTIDDQVFEGEGSWSAERCDTFSVAFSGVYRSEGAVRHVFESTGEFLYFQDVLEGTLTWSDRWSFGEASGTLEASEAGVVGRIIPNPIP